MRFVYGRQDMRTFERAEENGFLLTNGLGGYMALTAAFSVNRCDAGVLVAAKTAPNDRLSLVHRIKEALRIGEETVFLSTQGFADGTPAEDGYRYCASFEMDDMPVWTYDVRGVRVVRRAAMSFGENAACVSYEIENRSGADCTLTLTPYLRFTPKEHAPEAKRTFALKGGKVCADGYALHVHADAALRSIAQDWQTLAYPEDEKDGRGVKGLCGACFAAEKTVANGETAVMTIVFSLGETKTDAAQMFAAQRERAQRLEAQCGLLYPTARQLARAADAYITRRDSTGGKTIIAGYPIFGDWGRDTMIALPGLTLATKRYEDARSILRTFLAYERDGLVPNLFPEGAQEPMYNTVDAALLLIDSVWQAACRMGDMAFAAEAYPVMKRIVEGYQRGTHHGIGMDEDGLIYAGKGLDQVTWMDVCVEGILPTPRHGKPVEVNAYWYNALRIMERLAPEAGEDGAAYARLADKVKASFLEAFYMEERGCLRDVISGGVNADARWEKAPCEADEQIRCNQIWAVTMPFGMLDAEQARAVTDTVYRHLYTPCGLRSLSPLDAQYHPTYGGAQKKRDLAYHQGTAWVFPLGAYYLAYLKTRGETKEAAAHVMRQLAAVEPMLREGCAGQLPEIYDGGVPCEGKGAYAQAWSVGEMLRVYEKLEEIMGA